MKRLFYFIFFLFLLFLLLRYPVACISYGKKGLLLWFYKMLPTLFPFMVITGILVRLNLTSYFPSLSIYVILMGFLCGFPLGAYTAVTMYRENQISNEEAQYLISFTNNLGPAFFLSYVLPTFHLTSILPFLIGMYGIPLFYGFILRYTKYKNCMFSKQTQKGTGSLPVAIDSSITDSITAITKLGGYMILLETLYIVPELFTGLLNRWFPFLNSFLNFLQAFLCCSLEITGGISYMQSFSPVWTLCLLPLGGFSCLLQAGSILSQAKLPIFPYLRHKIIQTLLSVFYYAFLIFLGFLPK